MVTVAIFMLDIASNLVEWIISIITITFTTIFTIIVSAVLFIASIVIGLLSCVVFAIRRFNSLFKEEVQEEKKENLK